MTGFRKTKIAIKSTVVLLLLVGVLGWFKSGGITTALVLPQGVPPPTDIEGVQCEPLRIEARLADDSWFQHTIVGELCWRGELAGKTLQVLVSGSGYGPIYWDFPYQPETYSYRRAALLRDYATFNYYRSGIGASDHPFSFKVDVDGQAHVLNDIVTHLKQNYMLGSIVTVGHSLGSVIAISQVVHYAGNVDGIILTGFIHNFNPAFSLAMRDGVDLAAFSEEFFGHIVDPFYLISKTSSRAGLFYTATNADPEVIAVDELNRQTTTIGEVISMINYFGLASKTIAVPVLIVTGENDFVVCGGALDCTDHAAVVAHERKFFASPECIETVILDDTGHNVNLHRNAPQSFALMLDWVGRKINGAEAQSGCEGAKRP